MVQFLRSSILVAMTTAAALAAPAPAGSGRINGRQDGDTPSTVIQGVLDDSAQTESTAEFLMMGALLDGSADITTAAQSGLASVQNEIALLSEIQDALENAGIFREELNIQDILASDNALLGFYQEVIDQQPPSADVAQQCGVAIACSRNPVIDEINPVLDMYNQIVGNSMQATAQIQQILLADENSCSQPRTACT
ncbi:hypothetical protein F5Y13DRAFT_147291 [Hypoxylon sp. FL1857]|nr:hypothetical protein F5Y13DRAFT_147291 [Hypoxylon sp. FL1857]